MTKPGTDRVEIYAPARSRWQALLCSTIAGARAVVDEQIPEFDRISFW